MTNSPTQPDRLDRIESVLERLAIANEQASNRLSSLEARTEVILLAVQQQQSQISDLRESVADTVQMVGSLANEMHQMQSEIRGLQTENRRILDRLERHMGDGHGVEQ